MPKYPTFFRADDEIEPAEKGTPSPNEWFGLDKTKYRSSPTFSEDEEGGDGWRDAYRGGIPADPMDNPLRNDESKLNSLKFKDEQNDPRRLIFVLEHAAEVFEAQGDLDLAAECECLCELALEE